MILQNFPKRKEEWAAWLGRGLVPAVVVLVGILCFGLGRLSADSGGAITIHPPSQTASAAFAAVNNPDAVAEPDPWLSAEEAPGKNPYENGDPAGPRNFVASKNGSKYYPAACSGVNRISEKNKIWFASEETAQLAGFSRAANCKW
jgi:hypothetical protein